MTVQKKEIRRILMGYIDYSGEYLIASNRKFETRFLGMFNGSSAARIFGVKVKTRKYELSDINSPEECCAKAFADMGRRIELESDDVPAVFHSPVFFNPAVLCADIFDDNTIELKVYTARTIGAPLTILNAFRKWQRHMPEGLERLTYGKTDKGSDDSGEKTGLRERRQEKKRRKIEKKVQKLQKQLGNTDQAEKED